MGAVKSDADAEISSDDDDDVELVRSLSPPALPGDAIATGAIDFGTEWLKIAIVKVGFSVTHISLTLLLCAERSSIRDCT